MIVTEIPTAARDAYAALGVAQAGLIDAFAAGDADQIARAIDEWDVAGEDVAAADEAFDSAYFDADLYTVRVTALREALTTTLPSPEQAHAAVLASPVQGLGESAAARYESYVRNKAAMWVADIANG